MGYVLISFESPHHTIKADKALENIDIERTVYPIPREISKDCGLGLKVKQVNLKTALELFKQKDILYKHTFPVTKDDKLSLMDKFSSSEG